MYKLISATSQLIRRLNEDGSVTDIPMNQENTSYQAYLAWVAEGNEPLPADEA